MEPPKPVRRALIVKASHRQPKPAPKVAAVALPWWATAARDKFTEAGAKATELSQHKREARAIRPMLLE